MIQDFLNHVGPVDGVELKIRSKQSTLSILLKTIYILSKSTQNIIITLEQERVSDFCLQDQSSLVSFTIFGEGNSTFCDRLPCLAQINH